jgi:hypothetical protein
VVVTAKELTPEERLFLEGSTQRLVTKGAASLDSVLAEISDLVHGAARRNGG